MTGRTSIRHWPKHERPREKLLTGGSGALTDAELLAVLIGSGQARRSALDLAATHLANEGGIRELLRLEPRALCELAGIGPAAAARMAAAVELTRRSLEQNLRRQGRLDSPAATHRFLQARLRDLPHEVFCGLFLDNRHQVIQFVEMFRGTIDGATVHPREVVKTALRVNAAAVIFAHNHPSGVAEPSMADRRITERLRSALGLVDIRVLDHLVVGDGISFSFAERGLL